MAAPSVDLFGDKQLIKKLERLAAKDIAKAVRTGSRSGIKLIQKETKKTAPKDSGNLRKKIKVRSLKRSKKRTGSRLIILARYAGPLEFGTEKMEPRFYVKKAVENVGQKSVDLTAKIIKEEIDKAMKKV